MTLKLPRTIRLDQSDTFVFEQAAEPGEWAVTGSFLFWDCDIPNLAGKPRAAFRAGFAGIGSLGFSTLVVVSEAREQEREEAIDVLALHIHQKFGAPDMDAARTAAWEEIAFAASICKHDVNTLIAMHRTFDDGEIKEQFRTLRPRTDAVPGSDKMHAYARAFTIIETDDEPEEKVDLVALMGEGRR